MNQVLKKRRGDISFVAEGPLEQFQIDLIYISKSWFNNGFKHIFACVDVFNKKADTIPLKDREQTTTTKALKLYIKIRDQTLKIIHFKNY